MDAELSITEYRLFGKDRADGRKCGSVVIMVRDTTPAVPHQLHDTPVLIFIFDSPLRFTLVGDHNARHDNLDTLL